MRIGIPGKTPTVPRSCLTGCLILPKPLRFPPALHYRLVTVPGRAQSILKLISRTRAGHAPGQLVIQITDRCNAFCPQCGMRSTIPYGRYHMSEDDAQRLIDKAVSRNIRIISFTGGEPLLDLPLLTRLITYAHHAGIRYTRTGTNGFLFGRPEESGFTGRINAVVDALASTPLRNFWISIDSCDPSVHERMRGFPGVIKGVERALPLFHAAGLYPAANLGIHRNMAGEGSLDFAEEGRLGVPFEIMVDRVAAAARTFLSFVTNLGFTTVNMCYPMASGDGQREHALANDAAVYAATSPDRIVKFTPHEKSALFAGLSNAIGEHRGDLRIFTPRSSLYALRRALGPHTAGAYPCRGGVDFFFASAHGQVYPCGYRGGEPLGEAWGERSRPGPACYKCEWECFRDPSELFGPIADLVSAPWRIAQRWLREPEFMKLWIEDLRYFAACGFYNGRTAPNYAALARFAKGRAAHTSQEAEATRQPFCPG